MLDDFFRLMAQDGFSEWTVHARLKTDAGSISLSVPHCFTDGRTLLRTFCEPMLKITGKVEKHFDAASKSESNKKGTTRFQRLVHQILSENDLEQIQSIALAVDLSEQRLPEFNGQANRVAFPIFSRSELLALVKLDRAVWIETLLARAKIESLAYQKLGRVIVRLPPEKRAALYGKLPVNQVDLVLSYFGQLSFLLPYKEEDLSDFEFAVTNTSGAKQIGVLSSVRGTFKLWLTRPKGEPFKWDSSERYREYHL